MADLAVSRQTTGFYRTKTGACHQRVWPFTPLQLKRQQHVAQVTFATRDPDGLELSATTQSTQQPKQVETFSAISQQNVQQAADSHKQFPAAAVFAGLRLTHAFRIIAHVATHLALDVRHGLFRKAQQTQKSITIAQHTIQQAVVQPAQTISQAEGELKAAFARLQQHAVAGGDALMKMLHSLDKPSITLDKKWADMQEQLAGNKDISDRLQTLFASSVESTKTVAAMLAQNGGSMQQSYWTSPETQKVIEQEEELRSVVFAQMLGATS